MNSKIRSGLIIGLIIGILATLVGILVNNCDELVINITTGDNTHTLCIKQGSITWGTTCTNDAAYAAWDAQQDYYDESGALDLHVQQMGTFWR